jgi:hypothetical protein
MVRGSLVSLRRRCGKATCRCSDGPPHETPALSYSIDGVTHMLTLRSEDVPLVEGALRRYRQAIEELDARALEGIETLRQRIAVAKAEKRARRR